MRPLGLLSGCALLIGILTFNASAETSFMVQLGSYDSRDSADDAWQEIEKENADELDDLTHINSPLSLANGDDLYRLQAGPLESRRAAEAVCRKLKETQTNCFVVETAMFTGDDPSSTQALEADRALLAAAAKEAKIEEAKEVAEAMEMLEDKSEPVVSIDQASALPEALPSVSAVSPLVTASAVPAKEVTLSQMFANAIMGDDSEDEVELEVTNLQDAETVKVLEVEESQQAENVAEPIIVQENTENDVVSNTSATAFARRPNSKEPLLEVTDSRGRTTYTEIKEANNAAEQAIEVVEAPVITNTPIIENDASKSQSLDETEQTPESVSLLQQVENILPWANLPRAEIQPIAPVNIPAVSTAVVPLKQITAEEVAKVEAVTPPFTVIENTPRKIIAPVSNSKAMVSKPETLAVRREVIIQQIADSNLTKDNFDNPDSLTISGGGSVEIAEAIQVPLTSASQPILSGEPMQPEFATASGRKPYSLSKSPSFSGKKPSYWLKMNYFDSKNAAFQFWNEVSGKNKMLTRNVRARVSQPYFLENKTRATLQLGPFDNAQSASDLCDKVKKDPLTCKVERYSSASSAFAEASESQSKLRSRRDISQQAYEARTASRNYWVQIGSYSSRGDAMQAWDSLKRSVKALKTYQPKVASPSFSSARRQLYRLRTGPFVTRLGADQLCDRLGVANSSCLVVRD